MDWITLAAGFALAFAAFAAVVGLGLVASAVWGARTRRVREIIRQAGREAERDARRIIGRDDK